MINFEYCKYWIAKARENIHDGNFIGAKAFLTTLNNYLDSAIQMKQNVSDRSKK